MAFGKHRKNIFCVCEIANLFYVKRELFSLIFFLQVIFFSLLPIQSLTTLSASVSFATLKWPLFSDELHTSDTVDFQLIPPDELNEKKT